ncbi:MAG: COP23 domain-containing protein [Prochloraceae cyanobacterium]|nr:COP23 domain-containing protein [Prochloraceae cyanobacterium]
MTVKKKKFWKILLASLTVFGTVGVAKPSWANVYYSCNLQNGQPVTVANTPRGNVKLINWENNRVISNQSTPEKLCEDVSIKLQQYADSGELNYISISQFKGQFFVCVANRSGDCIGNNFGWLFDIEPSQNSQSAFRRLFNNLPSQAIVGGRKFVVDINKLTGGTVREDSSSQNNYNNPNNRRYPNSYTNPNNSRYQNNSTNTYNSRYQNNSTNINNSRYQNSFTNTYNSRYQNNRDRQIAATRRSVQYTCIQQGGVFKTIANTQNGPIELIIWQSNFFSGSGYTPETRCQIVTSRFQQHSDAKNFRYVSTGRMNGQNVICVSSKSGRCQSNGLLITLQPDDRPNQVLRDMFNLQARRNYGGIRRGKLVIDLERIL